jgi:hypothetical protein
MNTQDRLIDTALRQWKNQAERATKLFGSLSDEQLFQEIAPGKNRVIYIWGHLTAANDVLFPLLGIGDRLHPELDWLFVTNADRATSESVSREVLSRMWSEIHHALWTAFSTLSPSQWLEKHGAVSEEDFIKEPHRNRFAVLLGRTAHLSYHVGQAVLAQPRNAQKADEITKQKRSDDTKAAPNR